MQANSRISREIAAPQGYLEIMDPGLFTSFRQSKSESIHIKPEEDMFLIVFVQILNQTTNEYLE